jgi:hypothetical protein
MVTQINACMNAEQIVMVHIAAIHATDGSRDMCTPISEQCRNCLALLSWQTFNGPPSVTCMDSLLCAPELPSDQTVYPYSLGLVAAFCLLLQPGNSRRSLIKASFESFTQSLKVPAGYYTDPGSNIIKLCNDDVDVAGTDAVSYYCAGGSVGSAPRSACPAAGSTIGVYTPPDASVAADCWSLLKPGHKFSAAGTAVVCGANEYW